mmetsp:Transcript_40581/g.36003  ORF Transcript_40581/g.36003 Transcript_40581/m.36003 type:complete len:87 (+) Transcript_40581:639-899(+)
MYEMIFGHPFSKKKEYNKKSRPLPLVDTFKENGYITGHYLDKCGIIQFYTRDSQYKKIYAEPWDHEGVTMNCDPNYQDPETPYSII